VNELVTLQPGSKLVLCGPDGQAAVLTLCANFGAAPAAPSAPAPGEVPATAAQMAPAPAPQTSAPPASQQHEAAKLVKASFELAVRHARGCDNLSWMPEESRIIPVPAQGPILVGRQHQPGFFETLLTNEPMLLTLISRSHFELAPDDSAPGAFKLTNNSGNVLDLGEKRLTKGEYIVVRSGTRINFLGPTSASDPEPSVFLYFELLRVGGGSDEPADVQGVQPAAVHTNSGSWQTPPTQVKHTAAPPGQHRTPGTLFGLHQGLPKQQPAEQPQSSHYVLECTFARGCDVSTLPFEKKAVKLPADKLASVGRQHQLGLFEGLLGNEQQLLKFVSRSHFELAPSEGKPMFFKLTNNSGNPVVLEDAQVCKGEQREVELPATVDFVESSLDPNAVPQIFLRLVLEAC